MIHNPVIIQSRFKPAWWIPGAHGQTIWPYYFRITPRIPLTWERQELPDGDFLDLVWSTDTNGPLVILFHGLEGSIHSHYSKSMLAKLYTMGWQGVFMHFRGCSGLHNRLARSYHSGDTGDIRFIIRKLTKRFPGRPLAAVGYSLGGNALLKYLGEDQSETPLFAAAAVSVPFDLARAAEYLDQGLSRFYQRHLVRKLQKRTIEKFCHRDDAPFSLQQVNQWKTFHEFDDHVTAPLHGFSGSDEYYRSSSSRQFLDKISIPTLLIQSLDDPFLPEDALPDENDLSNQVTLELSSGGGHVGFIYGNIPGKAAYWPEIRIPEFLQEQLIQ